MAVKIGSARSSFGNTKAGDQSGGREVSTQDWYKHSKGWRVFRAIDPSKREPMAYCMQAACDNNHIGYDQNTRHTLFAQAVNVGYDPARVKVDCNVDCSALVQLCICYAWQSNIIKSFITDNEPSRLLASGLFSELIGSKYTDRSDYLQPGDILCTKSRGHTAIVLSYGSKADKIVIPSEQSIVIADGTWNVRRGPAKTYAVVGTVHGGEAFASLSVDSSGWYQIGTGWISPKAVKGA